MRRKAGKGGGEMSVVWVFNISLLVVHACVTYTPREVCALLYALSIHCHTEILFLFFSGSNNVNFN